MNRAGYSPASVTLCGLASMWKSTPICVDFPFCHNQRVRLRGAMSFLTDTIAALATPAGTSAIAVVRASGPQVAALVTGIFGETPRCSFRGEVRGSP